MPIKPENKHRYPKDWEAISRRIRFERARGRCECLGECGRHDGRCGAIGAMPHPRTGATVVLTVAHLNHRPEDCEDTNLKAMCQACHLAYDAPHHRANAHATRRARKALGDLFGKALRTLTGKTA